MHVDTNYSLFSGSAKELTNVDSTGVSTGCKTRHILLANIKWFEKQIYFTALTCAVQRTFHCFPELLVQ